MIDVLKNKFFSVIQADKREKANYPKGYFEEIRYQIFGSLVNHVIEKYKNEIKQNADGIDYFSDSYSLNLYIFSYDELKQLIDEVRQEERGHIMYTNNYMESLMEGAKK